MHRQEAFKRMKDVFAGSVDIPQIKPADFNFFKATHPIVSILVEGVYVHALLDTGSMRSFVSDKVHAIFDFNNLFSSHVGHVRFVSITGDPLDIKCSLVAVLHSLTLSIYITVTS